MNARKKIGIIVLGLAIALITLKASAQTGKSSIEGKWYAEELDQSVIEITRLQNGNFEGVIKSSSTAEYLGHKVIYDFKYDKDKRHYNGTINSAARNIELDGTIVLQNTNSLKVTGKKLWMSKTFYWTKQD